MIEFIPVGEAGETGLLVKKKGRPGYAGRISTGGRWPGHWAGRAGYSVSPTEMVEIGKKCVEIRRQVQATRNMCKTLCK